MLLKRLFTLSISNGIGLQFYTSNQFFTTTIWYFLIKCIVGFVSTFKQKTENQISNT